MVENFPNQKENCCKTKFNPEKHHRRSIRLKGYDYSQPGAYFITICTKNRKCLFGNIINGKMILNDAGHIAQNCWLEIPNHYPNVILDEFIIMPNHIHGIIIINAGANDNSPINVGANNNSPRQANNNSPRQINNNSPQPSSFRSPSGTIGSIVRGFKIGVTKWFRQNTDIYDVWQRNYYEHIIRNEQELDRIRKYIINNPLKWELDKNYSKK